MRLSSFIFSMGVGRIAAQSFTDQISTIPELSNMTFYVGQNPELRGMFDLPQNVTILAPENRAFIELVRSVGADLAQPLPDTVRGFLQYHIVNGTHEAGEFNSTSEFLSTHLTNPGNTNVSDGQVVQFFERDMSVNCISGLNAQSQIVRPDIRFDHGIIHIVNQVLTLPQSTTSTLFAANLTAFLGGLGLGGNGHYFNDMRDITVFAPRNQGFERIGSVIQNISPEDISRITNYHMIPGQVLYSTDLQNATLSTLAGEDLNVSVIDGVAFINSARVESTDVLINNGVMHVISDVLNPDNRTVSPEPASETQPVAFGGASFGPVDRLTGGQPTPTAVIPLFPAGYISGGPTTVPTPTATTTSEATTTATSEETTTTSSPTTTSRTTKTASATTTTSPSPTTTSPSPPTDTSPASTPSPTGPPAGAAHMQTPRVGIAIALVMTAFLLCI